MKSSLLPVKPGMRTTGGWPSCTPHSIAAWEVSGVTMVTARASAGSTRVRGVLTQRTVEGDVRPGNPRSQSVRRTLTRPTHDDACACAECGGCGGNHRRARIHSLVSGCSISRTFPSARRSISRTFPSARVLTSRTLRYLTAPACLFHRDPRPARRQGLREFVDRGEVCPWQYEEYPVPCTRARCWSTSRSDRGRRDRASC